MPTWISTVGLSPYAVINPFWAYCRNFDLYPNKVTLIHTTHQKIEKNYKLCKNGIKEILLVYSTEKFNIEEYPIKSEDIHIYSEKLKDLIEKEGKLLEDNDYLILDMTPGRKYMSSMNLIYGMADFQVPIQVLYLHLYDDKFLNFPYQKIPIFKNRLIDIFSYASKAQVFDDIEIMTGAKKDKITENLKKIYMKNLFSKLKNKEEEMEFLILSAIFLEFNSDEGIRKFIINRKDELRDLRITIEDNHDFAHLINTQIKNFKEIDYIYPSNQFLSGYNKIYNVYKLTKKGRYRLKKLIEKNKIELHI